VYLKKGGSHLDKNHPYIKLETAFNSFYKMNKVMESVFNPKHRLVWDKDVLKFDISPVEESTP